MQTLTRIHVLHYDTTGCPQSLHLALFSDVQVRRGWFLQKARSRKLGLATGARAVGEKIQLSSHEMMHEKYGAYCTVDSSRGRSAAQKERGRLSHGPHNPNAT